MNLDPEPRHKPDEWTLASYYLTSDTPLAPPGTVSFSLRRELGLWEDLSGFDDSDTATVEFLPSLADPIAIEGTDVFYAGSCKSMYGRPGAFGETVSHMCKNYPVITLTSRPSAWGDYVIRRLQEETDLTVLSREEAKGYCKVFDLIKAEQRGWSSWQKMVFAVTSRLNRMLGGPRTVYHQPGLR